jgi:hypothetical protein
MLKLIFFEKKFAKKNTHFLKNKEIFFCEWKYKNIQEKSGIFLACNVQK